MSDVAYFEFATVIPPEGSQREGTPAHYLVEVLIHDPETQKLREEAELRRIAIDRLNPVLYRDRVVTEIPGLNTIIEAEAQKLRKVRSVGSGHDSWAFLVE
jgi:hypothetical protein